MCRYRASTCSMTGADLRWFCRFLPSATLLSANQQSPVMIPFPCKFDRPQQAKVITPLHRHPSLGGFPPRMHCQPAGRCDQQPRHGRRSDEAAHQPAGGLRQDQGQGDREAEASKLVFIYIDLPHALLTRIPTSIHSPAPLTCYTPAGP